MTYAFRFEAIPQEPFKEEALQFITERDPIGLLKKCQKRGDDLKTSTRRLRWQLWTACYAGALGIRRQPELFDKLLQDDYFDRRSYKPDIANILRYAMLIGLNADTSGNTYNNACTIAARLKPLFDAEVEPMEVLRRIEAARGLKQLDISDVAETTGESDAGAEHDDASEHEVGESDEEDDNEKPPASPKGQRPASPKGQRPSARLGSTGGELSPLETAVRDAERKRATTQAKTATKAPDHVAQEDEDTVILKIEVTKNVRAAVLETRRSRIVLEHIGTDAGWQRIVGKDFEALL